MNFTHLRENTKMYQSVNNCTNLKFFPNIIIGL